MSKWICKDEKTTLDLPYFQMLERLCEAEPKPGDLEKTPSSHLFYILRFRDWANIIPITEDGKVLLVRQFRAGSLAPSLEIPGGVIDSDAKDDATAKAHVLRELAEETGYEPLPHARCERLGTSRPNPALQTNHVHSWVVGPVRKTRAQSLDEGENIDVVEVSIDELPGLLRRGEIDHALMLTTVFHFLMREKSVQETLKERLREYSR